jgi:Phosphate uptake regulator
MAIDDALQQIEAQLQEMGQRVLSAVHGAMRALEERDRELADEVIAFDDEVDNHFLGIESRSRRSWPCRPRSPATCGSCSR